MTELHVVITANIHKATAAEITLQFFTMRHHASEVYTVIVCLSVCHKSVFCLNG